MKKTVMLAIGLLVISCEMKVSKSAKQDAEKEKTQQVENYSFPMENKFDENKYVEVWLGYEKVNEAIQPADWLKGKLDLSGETILNH